MIGTPLYRIEFRVIEDIIQPTLGGRNFVTNAGILDLPWFNVTGINKNEVINEFINKLESIKDV